MLYPFPEGVSLVETDESWLEEDVPVSVVFHQGMKCPVCGPKGVGPMSFSREDSWRRHWREFHESEAVLYLCPECPYSSKRPFEVKNHLLHHHGEGNSNSEVVQRNLNTTYLKKTVANPDYIAPGCYRMTAVAGEKRRRLEQGPAPQKIAKQQGNCCCEDLKKRIAHLEGELEQARAAAYHPMSLPKDKVGLQEFVSKSDLLISTWLTATKEANQKLLEMEKEQRRKADKIIIQREKELAMLKRRQPKTTETWESPKSRWAVPRDTFYYSED